MSVDNIKMLLTEFDYNKNKLEDTRAFLIFMIKKIDDLMKEGYNDKN